MEPRKERGAGCEAHQLVRYKEGSEHAASQHRNERAFAGVLVAIITVLGGFTAVAYTDSL